MESLWRGTDLHMEVYGLSIEHDDLDSPSALRHTLGVCRGGGSYTACATQVGELGPKHVLQGEGQ